MFPGARTIFCARPPLPEVQENALGTQEEGSQVQVRGREGQEIQPGREEGKAEKACVEEGGGEAAQGRERRASSDQSQVQEKPKEPPWIRAGGRHHPQAVGEVHEVQESGWKRQTKCGGSEESCHAAGGELEARHETRGRRENAEKTEKAAEEEVDEEG